MANLDSDFKASISIVHPSPIAKSLQNDLPDNYTRSQNSNVFALLYGIGNELEKTKNTFKQAEANNYLFAPNVQQNNFSISGAGKYLIEFDIPFTTPPLDVNILGSNFTDVFIEYTSRFGMVINVQSDTQDILEYRASGFVGAASDEYLGDALELNFGSLYQFPRTGDSVINDTYVSTYETGQNKFVKMENIIPVENVSYELDSQGNLVSPPLITKNSPPLNSNFLIGIIQPTKVVTEPRATHQLVDYNGKLIALLDATVLPKSIDISSFYQNKNVYKNDVSVFILGQFTTFNFNRWQQPSYIQEVFRADNRYRRLLRAINQSLILGPTLLGAANMTEALISQPFIDAEKWEDSDYRSFKNSIGYDNPKYITYNYGASGIIESLNSYSQKDGYPTTPPIVEVKRVVQPWSPDTLNYENKPTLVSLDVPVKKQITELNIANRFDVTNELTRQLRLGIDVPEGGIINWNYGFNSVGPTGTLPASGFGLYEDYNYVFLNNPGDSITNINIFWYAQQFNMNGPTGYKSLGPLKINKDYFVIPTSKFALEDGSYGLPSELLNGYNANSSVNYFDNSTDAFGNNQWRGTDLVNSKTLPNTIPSLPAFVIQLDLRMLSVNNQNGTSTKMPTNIYDFILYSYGEVSITPSEIEGFLLNSNAFNTTGNVPAYYDADTSLALQPEDSPFATSLNRLSPTSLAQSSFAKFVNQTGYEYLTTMIGGQITFNKTVLASDIKIQSSINPNPDLKPPGIFSLQAYLAVPGNSGINGQIGTNQYRLTGTVVRMMDSNGQKYFDLDYGNYVLIDSNGNPIAILNTNSTINFNNIVNTVQTISGVVDKTIWDTRISISEFKTQSPIFSAGNDFDAQSITLTPSFIPGLFKNNNFLVIINGLPLGNQQKITATWTFNIVPTSFSTTATNSALAFSDVNLNNQILRGICSTYTGLNIQYNGLDPDDASYEQSYVSPGFNAFFIGYKDYVNQIGSKLTPFGDKNNADTLRNPILQKPKPGQPSANTILNFFSPGYGFISISILPNQEFYYTGSGKPVDVIRPNNNGFALQIADNSYAGLVFYGKTGDSIVDKPTRLLADFTYASANGEIRKKTIEVDDGGYANYVDAKHPTKVHSGSVFYIAGNSFKYPSDGIDQAVNQYSDNNLQSYDSSGQYYDRNPNADSNGNIPANIFNVDTSQNFKNTFPGKLGKQGPPARYRRPANSNNSVGSYSVPNVSALNSGYFNNSPEKIAYLQFDFSSLPIDAIVNNGILEIYFSSGFTIKQGRDINFTLNDNNSWSNSRISGNGKTFLKKLKNVDGSIYKIYQPLQNIHWRKNYFEITIPYAYMSEPNGEDFGIRNIFSTQNNSSLPAPVNPQPNLEYLGYINIDEIDTSSLTNYDNFIESSVGLVNVILSSQSVIFKIEGTLHFNYDSDGNTILANCLDKVNKVIYEQKDNCSLVFTNLASSTILGSVISEYDVLPSNKVLVYPFGLDSSICFLGYVASVLPSAPISFQNEDISIYNNVLSYVSPMYSEYRVNLLCADTYQTYKIFERTNNRNKNDISY